MRFECFRCALALSMMLTVSQAQAQSDEPELAEVQEGATLFKQGGCGWCHEGGGRKKGRGPVLMDNPKDDGALAGRIMAGKPGAMPAFANTFSADQVLALVAYIRSLKAEGSP